MPSNSRFETDLQAVRAARGLSLAQIQQETRIPVDVLRRFEEGDLIGDPTYNEVYLKAFLKSYAKAVGAPQGDVMKAYEAQKAGTYQGQLDPSYKGSSTQPEPSPEATPSEEDPLASPTEDLPSPVAAVRQTPPAPPAASPPIPAQRVSRPSVPSAKHSYDKNWGLIIGLFFGAVVVLASILWFLVWDGGEPTPEDVNADTLPVAAVDTASAAVGSVESGKRLQIPIRVTVTAGGNGLQNFRVTEAPNERLGHWIEPGEAMTYESDSLVVLWGEGAEGLGPEATLELQGERWTPAPGTVLRIDRATGQRLLDSLATAPQAVSQPAETTSDGA